MLRCLVLDHLWKAFDINSNVGGACGEIVALKGTYWEKLSNSLGSSPVPFPVNFVLDIAVASQVFEYKMSNVLEKPLYVSLFGFFVVYLLPCVAGNWCLNGF